MGARAAIYVRLSRDRVGETSTARQEKDTRALAAARGFEVVEVFSDVDLSAFRPGVVRPSYERMLAAAEAGAFEALIVWKVDRLARSLREFVRVTELLEDRGVSLLSVNESFDTSSPMGKAMLSIVGVFAELESGTISLRTKSAKAHGAALGQPNGGGRRSFGYTDQTFGETIPDEVAVLREVSERVLAGESLRSLAADLNTRGVLTTSGKPWTSSNLGRTVRSPHLAGWRVHRPGRGHKRTELTRTRGSWPTIFTEAEHERLLRAAGDHRSARVPRHLLTGVARCGACGTNLRLKTTTRYGRQYACQSAGCSRVTVKAENVEDIVGEAVARLIDRSSPDVLAALTGMSDDAAVHQLAGQLADDRAALEQLSRDHYVDRKVGRDVFLASASDLEGRIATAEARLSTRTPSAMAQGESVRDAWDSGDLDARRRVLGALVETVTIKPASVRGRSSFDVDRVDVVWRV